MHSAGNPLRGVTLRAPRLASTQEKRHAVCNASACSAPGLCAANGKSSPGPLPSSSPAADRVGLLAPSPTALDPGWRGDAGCGTAQITGSKPLTASPRRRQSDADTRLHSYNQGHLFLNSCLWNKIICSVITSHYGILLAWTRCCAACSGWPCFSRGLDWVTHRGPCQPLPYWDLSWPYLTYPVLAGAAAARRAAARGSGPVPAVPLQRCVTPLAPAPRLPFPASRCPGDLQERCSAPSHFSHGCLCVGTLIQVQRAAPPEPKGPTSFNPPSPRYWASVPEQGRSRRRQVRLPPEPRGAERDAGISAAPSGPIPPAFPQDGDWDRHAAVTFPAEPSKKPEEELWGQTKVSSVISLARRSPSSDPTRSATLLQLPRQKSLREAKHAPPPTIFSHFAPFISQAGMKL